MKIKKLSEEAKLPTKAYAYDAGLDLYANDSVSISPGETVKISTGVSVQFDFNTYGLICDRSSLGSKGIKVMGGVIDNLYTGEIMVCLCNTNTNNSDSSAKYHINKGDKIAQMLVLPLLNITLEVVQEIERTERGSNGFGSSGK